MRLDEVEAKPRPSLISDLVEVEAKPRPRLDLVLVEAWPRTRTRARPGPGPVSSLDLTSAFGPPASVLVLS